MTPAELAKQVMDSVPDKGSNTEAHFAALQALIEKAIWKDRARWHAHFRMVETVLGPKPMCCEDNCDGCQVEMEAALEEARLALKEMKNENPPDLTP